eukprot:15361561-Ditylum_brightwellii.AAC.1
MLSCFETIKNGLMRGNEDVELNCLVLEYNKMLSHIMSKCKKQLCHGHDPGQEEIKAYPEYVHGWISEETCRGNRGRSLIFLSRSGLSWEMIDVIPVKKYK